MTADIDGGDMIEPDGDEIARALERVPWLRAAGPPQRLAGLTNLNYRFGDHVLRLPGPGTSEYIDRAAEEIAARSAAAAGVNVEVLHFDASDGLMVTRFVHAAATMTPARFAHDRGAVERAARALHRLHTTAEPFAVEFRLFEMIDDYKALLTARSATLPDGFDEAETDLEAARAALSRRPVPLAPCHCDPLCENFLDDGTTTYLIDYEYAGNNDPMWDLGDLSVEGGFTAEQDEWLLRAYFGGEPPAEQVARMVIHKAMCDLLWTSWGVIQHVNGNPVDDFWAYAVGRFERCRALIASDEFASAVTTLSG